MRLEGAFVVVVVVVVVSGGGGQEVAGVEACVHDKWSDRCGDGSVSRPVSPTVFGWRDLSGARISRGSAHPPEGET